MELSRSEHEVWQVRWLLPAACSVTDADELLVLLGLARAPHLSLHRMKLNGLALPRAELLRLPAPAALDHRHSYGAPIAHFFVADTFGHNTRLTGYELDSLDRDGAAVQKTFTDHEVEDYVEPSMLGCFLAPWRCSRRGTRMRRRSPWRVEVRQLFGSQYPCTSGGGNWKGRSRKNNDHWAEDEMIELVDGVSRKGIGRWSKVKGDYFSTSIRTAVHLKDKWRNLVRACKAKSTSKKKFFHPLQVNVQKATEVIVKRFRHRILALGAMHLGERKK
ncbi:hypothetical protein C2845_PM01G41560 [Panicum miliaceum]|uniref:Uncharacterized protein n=1 Tax=Panicum miliaceum TaxID=4540 RepID=A0A3L6TIB5_PANMI|nr:hypothetical protein C2845_PM01G41560 [Panicum miliaceum]